MFCVKDSWLIRSDYSVTLMLIWCYCVLYSTCLVNITERENKWRETEQGGMFTESMCF